ncbi:DUF2142 domain-containing protein [Paraburkholderia caledonica]|uniref:DUF2142 domain-containing protein n=1 Tax=Paraburkholderia caledonica TaxID=134536 RepID=UPI0012602AF8|nr:DUF2142 domain-containing protein [Paraburkholderia caledonica]
MKSSTSALESVSSARDNVEIRNMRLIPQCATVFFSIVVLGCVLSSLIPPLQSPDEHDHINRAYLLAHMSSVHNMAGHSTGGEIDVGLHQFEVTFAQALIGKPKARFTTQLAREAARIKWAHQEVFIDMAGAAPYFPLAYLPQAIGLRVGEALDLPVGESYSLARFAALTIIALITAVAFAVWPPNALLVCVLSLPMTMFQIASASADGLAFAWLVLAGSLFMLGTTRGAVFRTWHAALFLMAVCMVVSTRPQLLPILSLPAVAFFVRRDWRWLAASGVTAVAALVWLYTAAQVVDLRMPRSVTSEQAIKLYVQHPFEFVAVFLRTLGDHVSHYFYWHSFVGILGWLDRPLPEFAYGACGVGLATAMALSIGKVSVANRCLLIGCALASILLTFFAMLATWTDQPAQFIVGVQGRYFIGPAILFAYALGAPRAPLRIIVCGAFVAFTAAITASTVIWTYYL